MQTLKHGTQEALYPDVYTDTFIFFLRSLCKIIWMNVHYFPNAPRAVKDNIYIGIRNTNFVWRLVPIHPNHNKFDACFVSRVCTLLSYAMIL